MEASYDVHVAYSLSLCAGFSRRTVPASGWLMWAEEWTAVIGLEKAGRVTMVKRQRV